MNTKKLIKLKAKELFSKKGFKNITLREIASELNKSYGNITYHYKNKEQLLEELFNDMNSELTLIEQKTSNHINLLESFLNQPKHSFKTIVNYLFFYKDYVELQRNYPNLFQKFKQANEFRKKNLVELLKELQKKNYLQKHLTTSSLEYIIELRKGIHIHYFQETNYNQLDKTDYTKRVNRLLFPYLTDKGKVIYIKS